MTHSDTIESSRRGSWLIAGLWVVLGGALIAAFGHNFTEMWTRWFPAWYYPNYSLYDRLVEGESYYTHGPIVPIVSLLIVFISIRHLSLPVRPAPWLGMLVLIPSLLLHLAASLARVNFASGLAMVGVGVGLILLFWGLTVLRRLWFPILFLLFMVPLPEVTISQWNFRLKMFSADLGVGLANLVGIIVERSGNQVFLEGNKSLVVANVCNGLRTLISLLAFGAVYVFVCKLRGFWRILLFSLTIPVAVAANSIRIVTLIAVADIWDAETAAGWWHDTSGMMIFVLAFLLMFGLERLILFMRNSFGEKVEILPLFVNAHRTDEDDGQFSRMVGAITRRWAVVGLLLISFTAVAAAWLNLTVPALYDREVAKNSVPRMLDIGGVAYTSYDMEFDDRTLTILETRDYLYRRYVAVRANWLEFAVIFSEDNRKGTHPPDVCLEGIGEEVIYKGAVTIDGLGQREPISARELIVQGNTSQQYFLYTYKCGPEYTDSFWRQQFMVFYNGLTARNASGALIEVSTPVRGSIEDARKLCVAMLQSAVPHLDKNLP